MNNYTSEDDENAEYRDKKMLALLGGLIKNLDTLDYLLRLDDRAEEIEAMEKGEKRNKAIEDTVTEINGRLPNEEDEKTKELLTKKIGSLFRLYTKTLTLAESNNEVSDTFAKLKNIANMEKGTSRNKAIENLIAYIDNVLPVLHAISRKTFIKAKSILLMLYDDKYDQARIG